MSLSYAAILPHNPILIPNIGKDNTSLFKSTTEGILKITDKIRQQSIDTVLIVSPHSPVLGKAFGINLAKNFTGEFKKFGDLATKIYSRGDIELSYKIKEYLETKIPVQIYSEEQLDYGVGIPLFYILAKKSDIKIIPCNISALDKNQHYKFGTHLRQQIDLSSKKIAVIASAHLSHIHEKKDKKIYTPAGKKIDKEIKKFIKTKNIKGLLNLPDELATNTKLCGLNPLLVLLGALADINYTPEIFSYEIVFGIGHLTAQFNF